MADREMPWDLEAEQAVLGAMLLDAACHGDVFAVIPPDRGDWFYRSDHRAIWAALVEMDRKKLPIDHLVMLDRLRAAGRLSEVGEKYPVDLCESVPSTANAVYYAKIVREKGRLRDIYAVVHAACNRALDIGTEPDQEIETIKDEIHRLGEASTTGDPVSLGEIVGPYLASLKADRDSAGIVTGFHWLDSIIPALMPGDMVIVGARPSIGKTAWASQLAYHAAAVDCVPTLFFSLEMGASQIMQRLVGQASGVPSWVLSSRRAIRSDDQAKIDASPMEFGNIYIDESSALTAEQLLHKAAHQKRSTGLGLVIIDYLQLMRDQVGERQNRNVEITRISRGIKMAARELSVPIVVLAQLNRDSEKTNRVPRLSDLRDGGAIEQDADIVLFLHRMKDEDTAPTVEVGFIIAKHRNGPLGRRKHLFNKATMTFHPLDTRAADESAIQHTREPEEELPW